MSDKHLHVIAFNVPYPADYGGVIDIFYKIKIPETGGSKNNPSLLYIWPSTFQRT